MILKILLSFFFTISMVFANNYNFDKAILSKNIYSELYYSIFGKIQYTSIKDFKNIVNSQPSKNKTEIMKMIKELSGYIPSQILRPIIYWTKIKPNKEKLAQSLEFTMIYKSFILRDAIQSPISSKAEKMYAYKMAEKIYHRKDLDTESFYSKLGKDFKEKSKMIADFRDTSSIINAIKETDALSFSVDTNVLRPYTLSFQGFIPGNEIKLFSKNGNSIKRMNWFKDNSSMSIMPKTPKSTGHISFKKDPIFIKYRQLIDEAKSSILITTPLLGGSIGITITDYLIKKIQSKVKVNPNFKVIISHPFQMSSPFSKEVGTLLIKVKSKINSKPLLSKHLFIINSDIKESDFFKRINNTRAMVIDGNSEYPQAYIGSKTLTDSDGGYNYDNMLWIKGPAAAHIQNSIFTDIQRTIEKHISANSIKNTFSITRKIYPH